MFQPQTIKLGSATSSTVAPLTDLGRTKYITEKVPYNPVKSKVYIDRKLLIWISCVSLQVKIQIHNTKNYIFYPLVVRLNSTNSFSVLVIVQFLTQKHSFEND